ncbi:MAG: hypothetical protein P8Y40_00725, partial [Desulfobacterales bacterium]
SQSYLDQLQVFQQRLLTRANLLDIARLTGKDARTVVFGHLLHGRLFTSFDRLFSQRFSAFYHGQSAIVVVSDLPTANYVSLV